MSARPLPLSDEVPASKPSGARKITLPEKDISRFRSLISAPVKGLLKELPNIAKMTDPFSFFLPKAPAEKFYEEQVEERLPTQPEALEKGLERFGKVLPYAATGGLGGIVRGGIGAAAGQAVEEFGGGPLAQTVAEAAPFAAPSFARKIVPANADQKAILEMGRKAGLSEQQLAPLMPENLKRKFFGKLASKGESTLEKIRETGKGASQIYKQVKTSPEAQKFLSPDSLKSFSSEMGKVAKDIPHAIRSQIVNDAKDLVGAAQKAGGVSGEELINFYKDISSKYNVGKSELELFKGPVKKAIASIDPELAKNFEVANKIWARQAKIAKTLRPGELEGLIELGEIVGTTAAAATGNVSLLIKLFGPIGVRKFSSLMLTSPRFQNLVKQSQNAVSSHNVALLKKTGELIQEHLKEGSNPE